MSIYKLSTDKVDNKKKPTRAYSKTTANSGATPYVKGDVLIEEQSWLLECKTKTTDSQSISVKKEWIEKNRQEMVFMGKDYSAIVFNFGPGQENYYIIDELTFQELLDYQKNYKK